MEAGCLSYSAGPSGRPQYREKGGLRSTQLHATRYVPGERCRAEFLLLQVQLSSHQAFLSRCAVMGLMAANLPSPGAERRIEPRFYFVSPLFGYSTCLITEFSVSHGSLWPRSPSASLQPPENLDRNARNPGCLGWRHTLIVRLEQHKPEPLSASLSLSYQTELLTAWKLKKTSIIQSNALNFTSRSPAAGNAIQQT